MSLNYKNLSTAVRILSIEMVERAKSGHPGMPLGAADIATVLFTKFLKFDASSPRWFNRDRFVLSAGHGSAMLYSLLYLCGYSDVNIQALANFRQFGSPTAGHPEYSHLSGVEATTGPLGQGFANAIGMAIAERHLNGRFDNNIIDHHTYVLCGDGCLMEGISSEAAMLAGHLKLSKLICLYDNNNITIDGKLELADSTDTKKRFESYGWNVLECDGHNYDQIEKSIKSAQKSDKPSMIICKTTIGLYSKTKAGSEKSHGSPLGEDDVTHIKNLLAWKEKNFDVEPSLLQEWRDIGIRNQKARKDWERVVESHEQNEEIKIVTEKDFAIDITKFFNGTEAELWNKPAKELEKATRELSGEMLEALQAQIKRLVCGSADLSGSNCVKNKNSTPITAQNYYGNYIHYGIREHAMAAILNGMALHSGIVPVGSTFLVFADYMRPAIRLAALMRLKVIYVFTHDSIYLGEDGPTHQPVEHLSSLRIIPNLNVLRPADAIEVSECWEVALKSKRTPSALVLSRQKLPVVRTEYNKANLSSHGAYVLESTAVEPDITIVASGSEVSLALEIKKILRTHNITAAVVSAPCITIFERQPAEYQKSVLGDTNVIKVFIEAGEGSYYQKFIRPSIDIFYGVNSFGLSGKPNDVANHFGLNAETIVTKLLKHVRSVDKEILKLYNALETKKDLDIETYNVAANTDLLK